jgi:hypothetical protein
LIDALHLEVQFAYGILAALSNVIQFADFRTGRNASADSAFALPSKPQRPAPSPIGEKPQVDHKARRKAWERAVRAHELYSQLRALSVTAYSAWEHHRIDDAKLLRRVLDPVGRRSDELFAKVKAALKVIFLTPAPGYTELRQKETWAAGIRGQWSGLSRAALDAAIAADRAWLDAHAERPRKPSRRAP